MKIAMQRYSLHGPKSFSWMEEDDNGDYVAFKDVADKLNIVHEMLRVLEDVLILAPGNSGNGDMSRARRTMGDVERTIVKVKEQLHI